MFILCNVGREATQKNNLPVFIINVQLLTMMLIEKDTKGMFYMEATFTNEQKINLSQNYQYSPTILHAD